MALFVPLSPELPMSSTTARYLEGAVHHHRALSPRGMSERLFTFWFNSFVYNQIWEDPRVDLKALALRPDSRMLTISSGGLQRPQLSHPQAGAYPGGGPQPQPPLPA